MQGCHAVTSLVIHGNISLHAGYQWAIRLRIAVAYRTNPKFLDYLETVDARKAMMYACVKRIYTHGIKCANADNSRRCDPEDVKDWFLRDFIPSWSKRETTRTDMNRNMAEKVKSAVAYLEHLRSGRAPTNSRAGLLPDARQIDITTRRLRTKTFEEVVILFKLEGANADIMTTGRPLYLSGVQLTIIPRPLVKSATITLLVRLLNPPGGGGKLPPQGPAPSSGSSGNTSSSQS